jgi:hypothetical protein
MASGCGMWAGPGREGGIKPICSGFPLLGAPRRSVVLGRFRASLGTVTCIKRVSGPAAGGFVAPLRLSPRWPLRRATADPRHDGGQVIGRTPSSLATALV